MCSHNYYCIAVSIALNINVGTEPPVNVTAVQHSTTSILVKWSPSIDATGYIIFYTGASGSDNVAVSDGSTDNYLLTGLVNGETYTISVMATSENIGSDRVVITDIGLGKLLPCQNNTSIGETSLQESPT